MSEIRQARLQLFLGPSQEDVSEDLLPDLLSFTYSDRENSQADEISIVLKDPDGKWASRWAPEGGAVVRALMGVDGSPNEHLTLDCGTFYIDTLRVSGSPRIFEIRAVSVPLKKPVRKRLRTRAWEKTTLKAVAQYVAKEAEVELVFDTAVDPDYDRIDQTKESDLTFLSRLCEEAGFSIRFAGDQLWIFDQASYEKKEPIETITLGESDILSWEFERSQSESYRSVTVSYRDPKQKVKKKAGGYDFYLRPIEKKSSNPAVMTYTATDPDADPNAQEYQLKRRATSLEEAKRLATAKLRSLNRHRLVGRLSMVGELFRVSGVVVTCKGFGSFDGDFIVEESTHTIDSSGYRVDIQVRRTNMDY